MSLFHLTFRAHSRSHGANAIALSSYRSGEKLKYYSHSGYRTLNCRRGKSEVLHTALINNKGYDREQLFNMIEKFETRSNAVLVREAEAGLPYELSQSDRNKLAYKLGHAISEKYNCAVDLAVHAPDFKGDQRNFHVHILFASRSWNSDKKTFQKRKYRDLNKGHAEVKKWREYWEDICNQAYKEAELDIAISSKSCKAQNIIPKYDRLSFHQYQFLRSNGQLSEYIAASRQQHEIKHKKLIIYDLNIEVKKLKQKINKEKQNHDFSKQGRIRKETSISKKRAKGFTQSGAPLFSGKTTATRDEDKQHQLTNKRVRNSKKSRDCTHTNRRNKADKQQTITRPNNERAKFQIDRGNPPRGTNGLQSTLGSLKKLRRAIQRSNASRPARQNRTTSLKPKSYDFISQRS